MSENEIIKRANENGCMTKVNKLMSLAHLMICVANNLYEEASDELKNNGLAMGTIKYRYNNYVKSSDVYFNTFATMIKGNETKMDLFSDMEELEKIMRKYGKIDE